MKPKALLQALLFTIVLSNTLVLLMVNDNNLNGSTGEYSKRQLHQMIQISDEDESRYRFENPILAYEVLEMLDIFEQTNHTQQQLDKKFKNVYLGTFPDNDYCKKHRAFMVNHPEVIFNEKNIITTLIHNSLLRKRIIPQVGRDIQPKFGGISRDMKRTGLFGFREDANNFFTSLGMYGVRAIGHQFSCLSQSSNSIPGNPYLYRKDYVSEGIVEYSLTYENRTSCFNFDKFFPKTWILYHEEPCKEFFRHLNSPEYQQLKKERGEIVYMRKIGNRAHQGRGVFPINNKEEEVIKKMYKNGALCGKYKRNNIVQYYVHNPLLLFGHKFDFRVYMLIASTNPLMAYYYDGFLRVSLHEYDASSKELGAILTNTALSKSAFGMAARNGTFKGKTAAELKDFHLWNFQRLENYLLENGVVTDQNWLDNYLRPEFRKACAHLLRLSQEHFLKKSSVYHVFGLDFMLDENLNLWFIEANAHPALEGFSAEMKDHVTNMMTDHFEIVFGLMRSRMKRVIEFVNRLIAKGEVSRISEDEIFINRLPQRLEEFQKITENYFEPEFRPSPNNKFQPVVDENLVGEDRYFGLIREDCI